MHCTPQKNQITPRMFKMEIKKILKLLFAILICQTAGIIGSIFTTSSVGSWYLTLNKPSFNPPNWVFSPVWITIFILMGISLYLFWEKSKKTKKIRKKGLTIFTIQLILNIFWSALFFGLKSPLLASIEIILLWSAILYTITIFKKISKTASYLLLPYLIWVTFAAILNLAIVIIN